MNETVTSIYAPSLYWFAYEYHEGLVTSSDRTSTDSLDQINPEWVAKQYKNILAQFDWKDNIEIRKDRPSHHFDLLQNIQHQNSRQFQLLTLEEQGLEGFIYPQSIHDTYALNLNIYYPENEHNDRKAIADLANLNPQNCFKPASEFPIADLGQTLLLSAYLSQPRPENIHDLENLARQCWQAFFNLKPTDNFPPLYRASNLFGGYLYEYGNPKADLTENPYGHLCIWFLFEEKPTLILEKCYWELPELFLYYHKINKTFRDSRISYTKADNIVNNNETKLNNLKENYLATEEENEAKVTIEPFSDRELQTLKNTLKSFLKTSLDYSQELRNLEYARNTITINAKNYQATLEYIEQLTETPIETFRSFTQQEAIAFPEQIAADLNYFKHSYSLLDSAIATIRGLVEIDQAERDRQRQEFEKQRELEEKRRYKETKEEAEKERERQEKDEKELQDNIQAIGVGIASGAIIASSSGVITQPWFWPNHEKIEIELPLSLPLPHPFLIAVIGSAGVAIAMWKCTQRILKKRRSPIIKKRNESG